ncbi:MAG: HD domain-containing protein [bacterium]|nr:HD domain-containing protein [bacterium]
MENSSFISVTPDILRAVGDKAIDVYIQREEDDAPILFRSKTYPFTEGDWLDFKLRKDIYFLVDAEEFGDLDKHFEENLTSLVNDENAPVEEKCEAVYNVSHLWMHHIFETSNPEYVLETSEQILPNVLEVIFSDRDAAHNFIVKASVDYELYSHSLNVCLFGVGLAHRTLGISKQEAMNRYGPGFLWHDLGKLLINKNLWDKEDLLGEGLHNDMRQHTVKGVEMLKEYIDLTPESESIILHHHERLDGSGYPFGLSGGEISMGARICGIVDVFDTLSTGREDRERMVSFEALKYIRERTPHQFDAEVFHEFVIMFLPPREANALTR